MIDGVHTQPLLRPRPKTFGVALSRLLMDDNKVPKVISMLSEYLVEHGSRCQNLLYKKTNPETYAVCIPSDMCTGTHSLAPVL